jgi:lipopolysaccharide/colanic/teichoic acid biosynthesis glycosyltransferase
MHILYYHQHFTTPQGSGGTRSYEMAKGLIERGHSVTMICGSYADANIGLNGEYIGGMRKGDVDGIHVIEFCLPYSNYDSLIKRAWIFLKYAIKSTIIAMKYDYDLLFATSTPLTAGVPGITASLLRHKPFIFEVRDLWPELPRAMGVITNPLILKAMDLLEWISYHCSDACIGLSPGIVKGITQRGIDKEKVTMIPNGCDLDLFALEESEPFHLERIKDSDFVAIFTGAHGVANGLDAVLDAARELANRGRLDIKLIFIGDGKQKPRLITRAETENLYNCIFLDPMPKQELTRVLKGVNLGMMILANVPAFYYGTSPNKFFDYIASGLPVLNNYPGWLADMIFENKCGIAVPPDNHKAFADALEYLADNPEERAELGRNAHLLAKKMFDRKKLADEFVDCLETVVSRNCRKKMNNKFLKYLFDMVIVIPSIIICLPLLIFIVFIVYFKIGSPVIFKQVRPGMSGKPFVIYKFRTMNNEKDEKGRLLPDSDRLSQVGKFLRAASLDELPELFNVLKGDMSIVGPRPLLMRYLDRYTLEQARRHEIKPGLTGWAQINGRNAISWEEKFKLDVWYVDHRSFWLDLKIILLTIWCILKREGINYKGQATMEEFLGSSLQKDNENR